MKPSEGSAVGSTQLREPLPRVTEIMSWPPVTVTADLGLNTVQHLLLDDSIRALPVVNARGHPVGILSRTDLLQASEEGPELEELVEEADVAQRLGYEARITRLQNATVGDLMTRNVLSVPQTATVLDAARLMAAARVHRVLVVAPDGAVNGVVSSLDILTWLGHAR